MKTVKKVIDFDMNITDIEKQFKDSEVASIKVISQLQKELEKVKEENKHLKLLLDGTVPNIENTVMDIGISNQRIIAEVQLALLKNKAINQELTLEESRKYQIFVDALEKLKREDKDDGINASAIPESELLRLVKDE